MYSLIDRIPSTRAVYIRGLVGRGQNVKKMGLHNSADVIANEVIKLIKQ